MVSAAGMPAGEPRTPGCTGEPLLEEGARLNGYEIRRVLGTGGMSVVYAATQLSLDRPVAIKVPRRRLAADERFRKRFDRESAALAALNHPNIVNIIDRGQSGDLPYFVMEFVDGISLERAITRGQLSYGDYIAIVRQVRDALGYIHANGVVHLDLKPANILLGRNGRVKVSDFGIAALAWDAVRAPSSDSSMLGTPRFMAPEQLQRATILDARTDIYALGVTYHLMFCGTFPENSQAQASLRNDMVPPMVDPLLSKAVAPEPSKRYATVEQFSDDLLEALVGTSAFHQLDSFLPDSTFGFGQEEQPAPAAESLLSGTVTPAKWTETTGDRTALPPETAVEDAEAILRGAAKAEQGGGASFAARRLPLRTPAVPLGIAAAAAVVAAVLWPLIQKPLRASGSPGTGRTATVAPGGPWTAASSLALPRRSWSFADLSPPGDLVLTTFNNRSLGSLPEELPVVVVKDPLGAKPQITELCSHPFPSQRGYSGVAFGEGGTVFLSADTGEAGTSFLARYTPAGSPDPGFGANGMVKPGRRCFGIDAGGGRLFLSIETGEVLVFDAQSGRPLGVLPKAEGPGIVRDLALDEMTGRVYGVRSGGMVVWEPDAGRTEDYASYTFRQLSAPDSLPPRALEGLCFSPATGRALYVPYKTLGIVEIDEAQDSVKSSIPASLSEAVFTDAVVSADGSALLLSDVARSQVRVLRRGEAQRTAEAAGRTR